MYYLNSYKPIKFYFSNVIEWVGQNPMKKYDDRRLFTEFVILIFFRTFPKFSIHKQSPEKNTSVTLIVLPIS